jgi:hypothetical protein
MNAELTLERTEWWLHSTNIAALLRYLVDTDRLDLSDLGDVCYFVSHPYKWSREYAEMTARREANDADELVAQLEATSAVVAGKAAGIRKGRPVVMRRRA